jgi:predicted small lipoprotein YifL
MKRIALALLITLGGCGQLSSLEPQDAAKAAQAIEDVQAAVDRSDQDLRRLRGVITIGCTEPAVLPPEVCIDGQSAWNHLAADYEAVVRPGLEKVKAVLRAVGGLAK